MRDDSDRKHLDHLADPGRDSIFWLVIIYAMLVLSSSNSALDFCTILIRHLRRCESASNSHMAGWRQFDASIDKGV
jgi:hypothetical protein